MTSSRSSTRLTYAAATVLAMSVAKLGFIRTHSMRAFTLAELAPIMEKVV